MKNPDDLISGPAYDQPPEKDPISAYYEGIREKVHAIGSLRELAQRLGAPKKVITAIQDWRSDAGNTGD